MHSICYVITQLKVAGAEKYLLDLASRLSKRGEKIFIACLGPIDKSFLGKYDIRNITIIQLNVRKIFSLQSIKTIYRLCKFIKSNDIEFIHLNLFKADIIGGIAAILSRRKFISTQHNTRLWRYSHKFKDVVHKYMHRYIMLFAEMIITPTRSVKYYLAETTKIHHNKICVIYHGIDLDKFTCKFRTINEKVIIGSLANFRPQKGHKYIVAALAKLVSEMKDKKIEMRFAGTGPTLQDTETMVNKLKFDKYVSFLGQIHNVPKFLDDINILIHAAVSGEAFCYAALEGLAAGKAVVVTNIDGLPEFIQDHYNGILIPIKSPEAIAKALIELITHPILFHQISKNAASSCRPFFSVERMLRETSLLYSRILDAHEKI